MSGPFLRIIFGLRGCSLSKARWSILMWTLILVIFIASGAATGGVAATTSFLDFQDEAKCRNAADVLSGTSQINIGQGTNRPNISPPAIYRIVAHCVAR